MDALEGEDDAYVEECAINEAEVLAWIDLMFAPHGQIVNPHVRALPPHQHFADDDDDDDDVGGDGDTRQLPVYLFPGRGYHVIGQWVTSLRRRRGYKSGLNCVAVVLLLVLVGVIIADAVTRTPNTGAPIVRVQSVNDLTHVKPDEPHEEVRLIHFETTEHEIVFTSHDDVRTLVFYRKDSGDPERALAADTNGTCYTLDTQKLSPVVFPSSDWMQLDASHYNDQVEVNTGSYYTYRFTEAATILCDVYVKTHSKNITREQFDAVFSRYFHQNISDAVGDLVYDIGTKELRPRAMEGSWYSVAAETFGVVPLISLDPAVKRDYMPLDCDLMASLPYIQRICVAEAACIQHRHASIAAVGVISPGMAPVECISDAVTMAVRYSLRAPASEMQILAAYVLTRMVSKVHKDVQARDTAVSAPVLRQVEAKCAGVLYRTCGHTSYMLEPMVLQRLEVSARV